MSAIKNTQIDGDVALGRNTTIGGNAHIRGSADVGHNLRVQGWLDAPNIKSPCKGLYATEDALTAAYPSPQNGWWALVGDTLPAAIYRVEDGKWTATGETGGDISIAVDVYDKELDELNETVASHEIILAKLPDTVLTGVSKATASTVEMSYKVIDGAEPSSDEITIPAATESKAGVMSAADKATVNALSDIKRITEKEIDAICI